jgi:hypothetical protein
MDNAMKALLIADTHFLWYSVGRWARGRYDRPRVDYMALRNGVTDYLIGRFGNVYDVECCAFVVNHRRSGGGMGRFTDLLRGFGWRVNECTDPTPAVVELLRGEVWDLVVLANGSMEALATAVEIGRKTGRKAIVATFDKARLVDVDGHFQLGREVLYEGGR